MSSVEADPVGRATVLRLRPPRHRIDPRAIWWWTIRAFITGVVVTAALAAAHWWVPTLRPWTNPALWVVSLFTVAYCSIVPTWRYRVHRWETTSEAVYAASGWLVREWRVAPISRIQTVDTRQGPLQRLLGLSTVKVTTASAQGAVLIEGLAVGTADSAAQDLTALTRLTPGDAT